jgi:F0F1-type ATP synthase epsilon subunit
MERDGMPSASEIIEEWLCTVYAKCSEAKAACDRAEAERKAARSDRARDAARKRCEEARKELARQIVSINIPQDALRVRGDFVRAMEESLRDFEAVAQFLEEHADESEPKAVHVASLRTEARELQTSIDQIVYEDPFVPNMKGAPGHEGWHPTGYAGIAYARNTLLADCLRWITLRWPAAEEQLRGSLARLTATAERVDAPTFEMEEGIDARNRSTGQRGGAVQKCKPARGKIRGPKGDPEKRSRTASAQDIAEKLQTTGRWVEDKTATGAAEPDGGQEAADGVDPHARFILRTMARDPKKRWPVTGRDGIHPAMTSTPKLRLGERTIRRLLPVLVKGGYVTCRRKRYTITADGIAAATLPQDDPEASQLSRRKARPASAGR